MNRELRNLLLETNPVHWIFGRRRSETELLRNGARVRVLRDMVGVFGRWDIEFYRKEMELEGTNFQTRIREKVARSLMF